MNSFVQSQSFGLKHQFGVYAMGAAKRFPLLPSSYEDMVDAAREKMDPGAFGYIAGGAGGESTMTNNRRALDNWQILTRSLLSRAEASGYSAIVVTLDTPLLAWREKDIDNAYLPFLRQQGLVNYYTDPVFQAEVGSPEDNPARAFSNFTRVFTGPGLTWEDLKVIRAHTKLPIILKGIQCVEDAKMALDYGADGILVSNHGGRQVDGAIGSLDVLAEIAHATGDQATILFDSGIRRGADVFKAMALGAKAVCVARPYALALALGGSRGVKEWASNLLADTELTLGLAGCASWSDVSADNLRRVTN